MLLMLLKPRQIIEAVCHLRDQLYKCQSGSPLGWNPFNFVTRACDLPVDCRRRVRIVS